MCPKATTLLHASLAGLLLLIASVPSALAQTTAPAPVAAPLAEHLHALPPLFREPLRDETYILEAVTRDTRHAKLIEAQYVATSGEGRLWVQVARFDTARKEALLNGPGTADRYTPDDLPDGVEVYYRSFEDASGLVLFDPEGDVIVTVTGGVHREVREPALRAVHRQVDGRPGPAVSPDGRSAFATFLQALPVEAAAASLAAAHVRPDWGEGLGLLVPAGRYAAKDVLQADYVPPATSPPQFGLGEAGIRVSMQPLYSLAGQRFNAQAQADGWVRRDTSLANRPVVRFLPGPDIEAAGPGLIIVPYGQKDLVITGGPERTMADLVAVAARIDIPALDAVRFSSN
jgi:hypothetical protein